MAYKLLQYNEKNEEADDEIKDNINWKKCDL